MATVIKSSKINFYKFVQVKEPSATVTKSAGGNVDLTKALNQNIVAINRIGLTLNSIASISADLKKVAIAQRDASKIRTGSSFTAEYTTPKQKNKIKKDGGIVGAEIADDTVAEANMADDAIGSVQLKSLSTLLIKNSAGSTLKTIHGAGA